MKRAGLHDEADGVGVTPSVPASPGSERLATRRSAAGPWIGLVARLIAGGALLAAGLLKVGQPLASARAVQAYQLLPFEFAAYVGYALPVVEIIVGGLLVLGLYTRVSAILASAMLVVFIGGIASAWARGLQIDCGCFGGGGQVGAGQTEYGRRIAEDLGMLLCAVWVAWRPRTALSLDHLLAGGSRR